MELGGLKLGGLNHSAIDAALDRLRRPVNVDERLWVLEQLVAYWHGQIRPEDGLRRARRVSGSNRGLHPVRTIG